MSETVTLKISGEVFDGWTSIDLRAAMMDMCWGFRLSLVDKAPGQTDRSLITDGASCEVWVSGDLFLTGYIDDVDEQIDDSNHDIVVSGRTKTGDLVDCSAVSKSWKNQTLAVIAADICKPFGIELKIETAIGAPFASFAVEPGETASAALMRAARLRGVMLGTNAAGELRIFTPSTGAAKLTYVLGRDMKRVRRTTSSADRFSEYTVKGQHSGAYGMSANDAALSKGTAVDAGVKRHRPITLVADDQVTLAGLKARAAFEATVRLGRSQGVTFDVVGWRDPDGKLLTPDQLARIVAARIDINRDFMLAEIGFRLAESTTSSLRFVRPEAYTTEVIPVPKAKKSRKTGKSKQDDSDWTTTPGAGA
ncbi:hypothetical protein MMA231_00981 [Asticcacaulis sp. MM231]|uniref:phage baseplate assembly protein n=1 Tax=Asticcacaulis sp. MM231 TaxID=3157666 RepID=UPI0032D5938A